MPHLVVCKGGRGKRARAALVARPKGTTWEWWWGLGGMGGFETLMYSLFRAFRLLISQPENTDH